MVEFFEKEYYELYASIQDDINEKVIKSLHIVQEEPWHSLNSNSYISQDKMCSFRYRVYYGHLLLQIPTTLKIPQWSLY